MLKHIPMAVASPHRCSDCKGTGADIARTLKLKSYDTGYIRCWTCNGNGLDPAAFFRPSGATSPASGIPAYGTAGPNRAERRARK